MKRTEEGEEPWKYELEDKFHRRVVSVRFQREWQQKPCGVIWKLNTRKEATTRLGMKKTICWNYRWNVKTHSAAVIPENRMTIKPFWQREKCWNQMLSDMYSCELNIVMHLKEPISWLGGIRYAWTDLLRSNSIAITVGYRNGRKLVHKHREEMQAQQSTGNEAQTESPNCGNWSAGNLMMLCSRRESLQRSSTPNSILLVK